MKNNTQEQEVEIVEIEEVEDKEQIITKNSTVNNTKEDDDEDVIIIDDEDVQIKDDDEDVVKSESQKKKTKRDFVKEVKELSELEDEKVEEILEKDDRPTKKEQAETINLLTKFKEYISGDKFNKKCNDLGSKHNLNGSNVKNLFIKNTLGTVADILNLTVSIIGDVILGVSNFINIVICNIATYTSNTLHKVINVLTLHCGAKY